jgi:hypothetical protein
MTPSGSRSYAVGDDTSVKLEAARSCRAQRGVDRHSEIDLG